MGSCILLYLFAGVGVSQNMAAGGRVRVEQVPGERADGVQFVTEDFYIFICTNLVYT